MAIYLSKASNLQIQLCVFVSTLSSLGVVRCCLSDTIFLQPGPLCQQPPEEGHQAAEAKRSMDQARITYDKAVLMLEINVKKIKTDKIPPAILQVENAWEKLSEAQNEYVLELVNAGKGDVADGINREYANLESDKEDVIEAGEGILKKEQVPEKDLSTFAKMGNVVVSAVKAVVDVGTTMGKTLGAIRVSKKQFQEFQVSLKDQLVENWDETAETKVFHGVEIAHYSRFLEKFQLNTGIDDKVRALLETMEFTDRMDDKVKTFTCAGTDTEGKYGMYAAFKSPQEGKIDVAYAMYKFKASFVGSSKAQPNQYKIWHTEQAENGLHRLTRPVVENVLTGKMMEPDRFFKKGDVDELAENFIVAKALQAFAHSGVIPSVTYVEDQVEPPRLQENE